MPETGLILGKFYPPHEGHQFLISTALSECSEVVVLVMVNDVEAESLPGPMRVNMIQSAHPEAFAQGRLHVYDTVNNLTVDYSSREADKAHARHVVDSLKRVGRPFGPFVLYTSEAWGDYFAQDIQEASGEDCRHRMVDQQRIAKPISAKKFRENPVENWKFLPAASKVALTKRFVICGAESSGTTTLTRTLSERYQTVQVPEWGRLYSEAVGSSHVWTPEDFRLIINEQHRLEDKLAEQAGPVMFCDTDGLATRMFHELYLKSEMENPGSLYAEMERYVHRVCYIITDDDGVDFENDGYRLFQFQRRWATKWFEDKFTELRLPFIKVTGPHELRLETAVSLVDDVIQEGWNFAVPVEYQ